MVALLSSWVLSLGLMVSAGPGLPVFPAGVPADYQIGGAYRPDPEVGIVIPDGVDVEVIRHGQGEVNPYEGKSNEAALDAQEAIFEAGLKSGKVQIHLPAAPSTEEGILSESDLSEVAAGEVPCCCCCC